MISLGGLIHKAVDVVVGGARETAQVVSHGFNDAGHALSRAAVSSWEATSDEARDVGEAVEKSGLTIGKGFVSGAQSAEKVIRKGTEEAKTDLVKLKVYASHHSCDIAVGAALAAALMALSDGDAADTIGAIKVAAEKPGMDNKNIEHVARKVAGFVIDEVWKIKDVRTAIGHKQEAVYLMTYAVYVGINAGVGDASENPGQYVAGVLIYLITSAICEGKLPGGYHAWRGLQSEL
ncbi:MAG: hypothetical protein AAF441_18325 [Pseudomonadota bacterium]